MNRISVTRDPQINVIYCTFESQWHFEDLNNAIRKVNDMVQRHGCANKILFIYDKNQPYIPGNFNTMMVSMLRELSRQIECVIHVVEWAELEKELRTMYALHPKMRDIHMMAYSMDDAHRKVGRVPSPERYRSTA